MLYGIINDAVKKKKDIDIQFVDIMKCFDSMWKEETMNDYYDAGIKDDRFTLIALLNEKCQLSVNTPVGETEKFVLEDVEMQGTVLAPLLCSTSFYD